MGVVPAAGASCPVHRAKCQLPCCRPPAAAAPLSSCSCPCSNVQLDFTLQARKLRGTDSLPKWQCHCGSAPCNLHQTGFFYHASQVAFWRVLPPQGTAERPPGRPNPASPGPLDLAGGRGAWVSWSACGLEDMKTHGSYSQSFIYELYYVCIHSTVDGELYTESW